MKQETHRQRESERRQHRALSAFAVFQCWMRGLDGVVFKKDYLLRILGLKKNIKTNTRLEWLKEDLGEYFNFVKEVMWAGKTNRLGKLNSFYSLWVSRRAFPQDFWSEALDDEPRIAKIPKDGPRMAIFAM